MIYETAEDFKLHVLHFYAEKSQTKVIDRRNPAQCSTFHITTERAVVCGL